MVQRQALSCDVTVPDTYAQSYLDRTAQEVGAAANQAAAKKTEKYSDLSHMHVFCVVDNHDPVVRIRYMILVCFMYMESILMSNYSLANSKIKVSKGQMKM